MADSGRIERVTHDLGQYKRNNTASGFLSISTFARRARLSPKALRLYDRLNLLLPAQIDQESGYRYYHETQLATARLIALLRRLDMPLAQIAVVIAQPAPDAAALIAAYWATVERRFATQQTLATYIDDQLRGDERSLKMFTVHQRQQPAQTVLTEQRYLQVAELTTFIGAAMHRLHQLAQDHGGVVAPPFVIYHGQVDEDNDGPVEVCVPIDPTQTTAALPVRHEPAHQAGYTTITKAQVAFPQILAAYDAVARWLTEQGHQHLGAPREIYFTDFAAASPNDLVCDIAYPIIDAAADEQSS